MGENELVKLFVNFESEEKAFTKFPEIWAHARFLLFRLVAREISLFDHEPSLQPLSVLRKIKNTQWFPNLYQTPKNSNLWIFSHSRKVDSDGQSFCPYTSFVHQAISDSIVIESFGGLERKTSAVNQPTYFLDSLQILANLKNKLNPPEQAWPLPLKQWAMDEFKITPQRLDDSGILGKVGVARHLENSLFDLFMRKKPKAILLTTAYNQMHIVLAAKRAKVPSIEIQHGALSPSHIGYSYGAGASGFIPDYFCSFGEAWAAQLNWPMESKAVFPTGYDYLEEQIKSLQSTTSEKREKLKVLIIDQASISDRLIRFCNELSKSVDFNLMELRFRPHPSNQRSLPDLDARIKVTQSAKSLYADIFNSDVVLGAYSTSLYEAYALGKNVGVLDFLIINDI